MISDDREFKKWVISIKPRRPLKGEFREEHIDPKMGDKHIIIFSCERDYKGEFDCSVIGVEKPLPPIKF
jgi:hypothetical protein